MERLGLTEIPTELGKLKSLRTARSKPVRKFVFGIKIPC